MIIDVKYRTIYLLVFTLMVICVLSSSSSGSSDEFENSIGMKMILIQPPQDAAA